MTTVSHYVFGIPRASDAAAHATFMVLTPTRSGWRLRSTHAAYQHDYASQESLGMIHDWISLEYKTVYTTSDREDALNVLTDDSVHYLGFLHRNGADCRVAVDGVVRHLEDGW